MASSPPAPLVDYLEMPAISSKNTILGLGEASHIGVFFGAGLAPAEAAVAVLLKVQFPLRFHRNDSLLSFAAHVVLLFFYTQTHNVKEVFAVQP